MDRSVFNNALWLAHYFGDALEEFRRLRHARTGQLRADHSSPDGADVDAKTVMQLTREFVQIVRTIMVDRIRKEKVETGLRVPGDSRGSPPGGFADHGWEGK